MDIIIPSQYTHINNLHGSVIHYDNKNSLHTIPRRGDLLDKDESERITKIIANCPGSSPLLFMPNSFKEFHEKVSGGKQVYKLLIFGILPDGRKAGVILDGIEPYFEIKNPGMSEQLFMTKVQNLMDEKYPKKAYIREIHSRGFDSYEKEESQYIRVYFSNTWDRKAVLEYVTSTMRWKTTTNDVNHWERVACRNRQYSMCAWNVIKKYSSFGKEDVCKLDKVFRIHVDDFEEYTGDVAGNKTLAREKQWLRHGI